MRNIFLLLIIAVSTPGNTTAQNSGNNYPQSEISNSQVRMKLYLPDKDKGYYRATRFDWSGIIASLEWKGHRFFGQWKTTHDPLFHEDLSGPAEASVMPGLGYDQAPVGGTFIRLGVGVLEKPDEKEYQWDHTYKIVDPGTWEVTKGNDWIKFTQIIKDHNGFGYIYSKTITLTGDPPGFVISHNLRNTGEKNMLIDQFNHNFFMIDGVRTGKDFIIKFPYSISTVNDLKGIVRISRKELSFAGNLDTGTVWLELKGYSDKPEDHNITVMNMKEKVGVNCQVDKPVYRQVFWACPTTLCPENFILLNIGPGKEESWNSTYKLIDLK